ncbi:uncharacterized protein CTHT_0027320 [Thermochaetoides thermophila DSM 1495]|uniref:Uncharacterized protein n=1 Tax=Chaetomium thermophilum (strain DSM 1495 / CBS 144.50 / IMI 039719) TaxID=759272 RepID=G0S6Y5_CHATD|nr:hypothetical protein CTHT_0027320 [Thermochaetoides thermophila DSM 1495]EGS20893.1 hypothetical protein CTHT_0027320 [Thermochaetoides thermophila DSM 1495]
MEFQYSITVSPKHRSQHSNNRQYGAAGTSTASSGFASEQSQPWTATRCHRLLRPLLAHIAALRKDKERRVLTRSASGPAATKSSLGKRGYPYDDDDYCESRPCRKYSRKGPRRTSADSYSTITPQRNMQKMLGRSGAQESPDLRLTTPFLLRLRGSITSSLSLSQDSEKPRQNELRPYPESKRCQHSNDLCTKTRCYYDAELAHLRRQVNSTRYSLYEPVVRALDSLLRATSPQKNQAAEHTSLLSICLRKVPECIELIKQQEEEGARSAIQGASVSFEIYSELESLGTTAGWRHLCLVARAHGLRIVQKAALDGLFEDPVTELLIRVCLEHMPAKECMGLIRTYVIRQYPKPSSTDDNPFASPALRPLELLRRHENLQHLVPGIVTELLDKELLPREWVLSKGMHSLWSSLLYTITETRPCADTVDLIATVLELLCDLAVPRKPRGKLQTRLQGKPQNRLLNALAALGSVVLLGLERSEEESEQPEKSRRFEALRRRLEGIVDYCLKSLRKRKQGGWKLGSYLISLCGFLCLPHNDTCQASAYSKARSQIESSWRRVHSCIGNEGLMLQYNATAALLSAIAHSCSRANVGLAPREYLFGFFNKMEAHLQLPDDALANMRVDGAFHLAERTGDLRDLEFAEQLQAEVRAKNSTPGQKTSGSSMKKTRPFSGMKWDAEIAEWMAATPTTTERPTRSGHLARLFVVLDGETSQSETDRETDASLGTDYDDDDDNITWEDHNPTQSTTDRATPPESESTAKHQQALQHQIDHDYDEITILESDYGGFSKIANESSPALLERQPHRVSRRLTFIAAGDELGFDVDANVDTRVSDNENASRPLRKRPARFRLSISGKQPGSASVLAFARSQSESETRTRISDCLLARKRSEKNINDVLGSGYKSTEQSASDEQKPANNAIANKPRKKQHLVSEKPRPKTLSQTSQVCHNNSRLGQSLSRCSLAQCLRARGCEEAEDSGDELSIL